MAKTISTHNGSTHSGKGGKSCICMEHNRRDPRYTDSQEHIDKSLSDRNVTFKDETLEQAYQECFGDAVKDYNASQSRKDRKIDSYLDKVKAGDTDKHSVHSLYEMIVQIGDCHDTGITGPDAEQAKEILTEYVQKWNVRNPQLHVVGAFLHCDEKDGTVHAHIDYIPVANYEKGMKQRVGLAKALEQQGFGFREKSIDERADSGQPRHTPQIQWEEAENKALEDICKAHGLEIEHPDSKQNIEHIDTATFKAEQDFLKAQDRLVKVLSEEEAVKAVDKAHKTIFGAVKGVSYQQVQLLQKKAKCYDKEHSRAEKLLSRAKKAEAEVADLKQSEKSEIAKAVDRAVKPLKAEIDTLRHPRIDFNDMQAKAKERDELRHLHALPADEYNLVMHYPVSDREHDKHIDR
jgi:desulfoferrodoxin (superoxide reductase-like protein)